MGRLLALAAVTACTVAAPARAGLQDALAAALAQSGRVSLTPLGLLGPSFGPMPDDLRFVDTDRSTHAAATYVDGPTFAYAPATGGLTLFAPPLLGPADEFGVRETYRVSEVSIYAPGRWSQHVTLPEVTLFIRNQGQLTDGYSYPADPDAPSYLVLQDTVSYRLNRSEERIDIDGWGWNDQGVEIDFASVLAPGLTPDDLAIEESRRWARLYSPYLPASDLPNARVVVHYGLGQHHILAAPRFVPAPTAALLAATAGLCLLTSRRR